MMVLQAPVVGKLGIPGLSPSSRQRAHERHTPCSICTVHMKGLFYTGNHTPIIKLLVVDPTTIIRLRDGEFMMDGFDPSKPNENAQNIIVRLTDYGASRFHFSHL